MGQPVLPRPNRRLTVARRALIAIGLGFAVFVSSVMWFEDSFIYFPEHGGVGEAPGEDVWLTTADSIRIHGWYLPEPNARWSLLHLHGNAGNLENRRPLLLDLRSLGGNVLAIDYRGYGKSQGDPHEAGLYADAAAAYAWLRERAPATPIVVHGESLGGGPACELGVRLPIDGLILQSTFTSIPDMARAVFPLPVAPLLRTRFDNLDKVARIAAPKLFVHSRRDEIVPFAMGERLFAAAQSPKAHLWLERPGHNEALLVERDVLLAELRRFLGSIAR